MTLVAETGKNDEQQREARDRTQDKPQRIAGSIPAGIPNGRSSVMASTRYAPIVAVFPIQVCRSAEETVQFRPASHQSPVKRFGVAGAQKAGLLGQQSSGNFISTHLT